MFGKNLKKMFGTVLSAAMLISALPAAMPAVYADDGEITYLNNTTVLHFQDYEKYKGGEGFNYTPVSGALKYPTSGGNFAPVAQASRGRDGIGLKTNVYNDTATTDDATRKGSADAGGWNVTLPQAIKDGKLYIAFDVQRQSDADIKAMNSKKWRAQKTTNGVVTPGEYTDPTGENSNSEFYITFNQKTGGNGNTDQALRVYLLRMRPNITNSKHHNGVFPGGARYDSWNPDTNKKLAALEEGVTHKVEMVTDVKTRVTSFYIDGVKSQYTHTSNLPSQNNSSWTNPFDSNVDWGIYTINLQFCSGIEYMDNMTMVYFDEDEEDSDTFSLEGERLYTGGSELKVRALADVTDGTTRAPYGVSLTNDSFNAANYTVTKDGEAVAIKSVKKGERSGEIILEAKDKLTPGEYTVTASNLVDETGLLKQDSAKNTAKVVVCDKVFYNETFDNGVKTIDGKDTTYTRIETTSKYTKDCVIAKMTVDTTNSQYPLEENAGVFEGNKGFTMHTGAWGYDAFKLEFTNQIKTGVISYSFDTSRLSRTDKEGDAGVYLNRGIENGDALNGWYMLYITGGNNYIYGPAEGCGNWGDAKNNSGSYNANQKYNVTQVLDMTSKKCHTYIDGQLLTTKSITVTNAIQNIVVRPSKQTAYFDNLRFQYLSESAESFKVSADKVLENGATSVNVIFEDPVAKDQIKAENFEVKKGDTAVAVTGAQWVDPYTAKVSFGALDAGEYTVAAKNIKNAVGASADSAAADVHVKGDGLYKQGFTQDNGTYTVSLVNEGAASKTAVLIAGVFVDGKMVECKTQDTFTKAEAKELASGAEDTLSVTLTQAGTENAVVKVFLWDSLAGAKPLYEQLNQ